MSLRNRRGNSTSQLATALCLLSSGAVVAGENVPKLVRTTVPIRVNSEFHPGTHLALPQQVRFYGLDVVPKQPSPNLQQETDGGHTLRVLLGPNGRGAQRTNHFVELRGSTASRFTVLPQRVRRDHGTIQANPLVVDAPPKLHRFPVNQRPPTLPMQSADDSLSSDLITREQRLSKRQVEGLDQTLELLSSAPDQQDVIRSAARHGGFGMLAIDQIGRHLPPAVGGDPKIAFPTLERFATAPVPLANQRKSSQPNSSMKTLRDHLGSAEPEMIVQQNVPQLPPPDHSLSPELPAIESVAQGGKSTAKNPPIDLHTPPTNQRMEPLPPRTDQLVVVAKPEKKTSFVKRLTGWTKRLAPRHKPSQSKPVSTRLKREQSEDNGTGDGAKRSNGIFSNWFSRPQ